MNNNNNSLTNILNEINSKNNTVIKNKMDLINYISQFGNFLRKKSEQTDYANIISILKENNVIEEEYEDELFIVLCIRKFIQDFKLNTENLNNKNTNDVHEQIIEQTTKKQLIEPLEPKKSIELEREHNTEPKLIINCNYDNNNNNSNEIPIKYTYMPYYISYPEEIKFYVNDNIRIAPNPVEHEETTTAIAIIPADNNNNDTTISDITVTYADLIKKRRHHWKKEKGYTMDTTDNLEGVTNDK
jgi:hypothetical protein